MLAVVVSFRLKPGQMTRFLPLMVENAKTSLAKEPGCSQFDVCTDPDLPDRVFLYELYETADAFALHLQSDHFAAFDRATADLISHKEVQTFREVRG